MSTKLGHGLTSKKAFYMASVAEIVRREGWNPRFDFGDMEEMILSVRTHGVKNPLWVRRVPHGSGKNEGKLEIVDGDRRFTAVERINQAEREKERAAGGAALITEVPVRILEKDISDADALILAVTANVEKPLLPLEEAGAYKRLLEDLKCSPADLSRRLGRSEAHIKDRISLLSAAPAVQEAVQKGNLGSTLAENIVHHTSDHKEQTELAAKATSGREGKRDVQEKIQGARRTRKPKEQKPDDGVVSQGTVEPAVRQTQDLEMGQLADLTVLVQRLGLVPGVAGVMSWDEIQKLVAQRWNTTEYPNRSTDQEMLMFRLGAVMAFRAARGENFTLLP